MKKIILLILAFFTIKASAQNSVEAGSVLQTSHQIYLKNTTDTVNRRLYIYYPSGNADRIVRFPELLRAISSVSNRVTSFNTRTGNVTSLISDYNSFYYPLSSNPAGYSTFTPSGTSLQYIRGNGTYATFPTNVSSFINDVPYLTASALTPYALDTTVVHRAGAETIPGIKTFNNGIVSIAGSSGFALNGTGDINTTGSIFATGGRMSGEFHFDGVGYINFEPTIATDDFSFGSAARGFVFKNIDATNTIVNQFNNTTYKWDTYGNDGSGTYSFHSLDTRDLVSGGGTIPIKDSTSQIHDNLFRLTDKSVSRTNLGVSNKNNFINALDLGAIADGTTDNSSIINTALLTYPNIYFPNGVYYFSTSVQMANGQNIWGSGNRTVFKVTADTAAIHITASGAQIRDIKILGSGRGTGTAYATTKTHQNGIKITGAVLNTKIINVVTDSLANAGIRIGPIGTGNSYPGEGATISGGHFQHSLYGILLDKLAEYNSMTGVKSTKNQYGIYIYGGNNSVTGGGVDSNRTAFKLDSGINDGHSVINSVSVNHNLSRAFDVTALTNGYLITNCPIYFSNSVKITNANNVKFHNNYFKSDSLIMDGAINTIWEDNTFITTPAISFINGYTARFFNNHYTLGVIPSSMVEGTESDLITNGHSIINGNSTGSNTYQQLKVNGSSIGYFGSDAAIRAGTATDVDLYVNGNHPLRLATNNIDRITISGAGAIAFPAFSANGLIHSTVATGLLSNSLLVNADITNSTIDLTTKVTGSLPVVNGGTGQSTYINGQLLIGNTTGNTLNKATLTAGNGAIVTNSTGSITLSADTSILVSKTFAGRYDIKGVAINNQFSITQPNANFKISGSGDVDTLKNNRIFTRKNIIVGDSTYTNKQGGSIVLDGNSITIGTYSTNISLDYANRLSYAYGVVPVNKAISGTVITSNALTANHYSTYTTAIRYITEMWGTNEIGAIDTATYHTNYRRLIDTLIARSYPLTKIVILGMSYTTRTGGTGAESYAHIDSVVAVEKGVRFVENYHYMLAHGGTSVLTSDGLHPTLVGNNILANHIITILADADAEGNVNVLNTVNALGSVVTPYEKIGTNTIIQDGSITNGPNATSGNRYLLFDNGTAKTGLGYNISNSVTSLFSSLAIAFRTGSSIDYSTTTVANSAAYINSNIFQINSSARLNGSTSGQIIVNIPASFTSYNWNYPTTLGGTGTVLTSGGTSSAMTWSTPYASPLTTTGDIVVSTAATTPGRIAAVAKGSVFISQGVTTVPAWSTKLPPIAMNAGTGTTADSIGFWNGQQKVAKLAIAGYGMLLPQAATTYTPAVDTSLIVSKIFSGRYATINGSPTFVTQTSADNSTKAATTAFVKAQAYGTGTVTNVTSANTDIGIISGTTVPVLTFDRTHFPYSGFSSLATGDFLFYNGSNWANRPLLATTPLNWNSSTGTLSISGVPLNQASANLTAQTTAGNITTFTVGAAAATFNVSAYVNVTAVATDVIQAQVTYTDENSTSQTVSFTTLSTVSNSTYSPVTIRAKNGTVITLKTNLTTGIGSITFDAGGSIIQN